MAGRGDAADGHGHGDRPGRGLHDLVAHAGQQPVGGDQHVVGRAVVQDDAELVAGQPPEMILAAQLAAHPLGHRGDHLFGDFEAVGFVDASQIVDRHQQEAAGRAQLDGFIDGGFQHLDQVPAVHLAGQRVETRKVGEPLLPLMAFVDDPHDPVGAQRLAVRPGKPAPGVLDPEHFLRARRA